MFKMFREITRLPHLPPAHLTKQSGATATFGPTVGDHTQIWSYSWGSYPHLVIQLGIIPKFGLKVGDHTHIWSYSWGSYPHLVLQLGIIPTFGPKLGDHTHIWSYSLDHTPIWATFGPTAGDQTHILSYSWGSYLHLVLLLEIIPTFGHTVGDHYPHKVL